MAHIAELEKPQPGDLFIRHFRIAALPYEDPAKEDGYLSALRAENQLRDLLGTGSVPEDVALLAPEMGCIAAIDSRGILEDAACAWRNPVRPENRSLIRRAYYMVGGIYCIAWIEVDAFERDPVGEWANSGSVVVKTGRVTKVSVPAWLGPIAPILQARYGVPVGIGLPQHPDFKVGRAEPLIIRNAITSDEARSMRAVVQPIIEHQTPTSDVIGRRFRRENEFAMRAQYRATGPVGIQTLPEQFHPTLASILGTAGRHFRLPVNSCIPQLMRYQPGAHIRVHTDRNSDFEFTSYSRTIGFSLLLSEAGRDFQGGELWVGSNHVELSCCDAVAFTSMTPHLVTPVEAGLRDVLVGFGSWDGWTPSW
jgi:hypothetical protein